MFLSDVTGARVDACWIQESGDECLGMLPPEENDHTLKRLRRLI